MDYEGKQVTIMLYPFLLEVEVTKNNYAPFKAIIWPEGALTFCRFFIL